MSNQDWPLYEVFVRSKQGLAHRHVGSLHAADDQMALENGAGKCPRRLHKAQRGLFDLGGKSCTFNRLTARRQEHIF